MAGFSFSDDTIVERKRELAATEVGGDLVMVDIEAGSYLALDGVGRRIWDLLEEPRSLSTLCGLLQQEFEVTAEVCRRDVETFLLQMRASDLVVLR